MPPSASAIGGVQHGDHSTQPKAGGHRRPGGSRRPRERNPRDHPPMVDRPACPAVAEHPEWSVARRWDEALLDAIRRALPNPPVHARNLFHLSVAMWDAWAAYDPTAAGYIVTEKHTAVGRAGRAERGDQLRRLPGPHVAATSRPSAATESLSEFDDVMDALCYPLDVTTTEGDTPGGGRQPDRRGGPRLRPDRRLERGRRLRGTRLQAGQPAARGRRVGHDDDRPEPLAAAPDRAHDLAERDPGDQRRPAGRRAALGPRRRASPCPTAARRACRSIRVRRRGSAIRRPTRPSRTRRSR